MDMQGAETAPSSALLTPHWQIEKSSTIRSMDPARLFQSERAHKETCHFARNLKSNVILPDGTDLNKPHIRECSLGSVRSGNHALSSITDMLPFAPAGSDGFCEVRDITGCTSSEVDPVVYRESSLVPSLDMGLGNIVC